MENPFIMSFSLFLCITNMYSLLKNSLNFCLNFRFQMLKLTVSKPEMLKLAASET